MTGKEVADHLLAQGIIVRAPSEAAIADKAPEVYKPSSEVVQVVHDAGLSTLVARLSPIRSDQGVGCRAGFVWENAAFYQVRRGLRCPVRAGHALYAGRPVFPRLVFLPHRPHGFANPGYCRLLSAAPGIMGSHPAFCGEWREPPRFRGSHRTGRMRMTGGCHSRSRLLRAQGFSKEDAHPRSSELGMALVRGLQSLLH